MNRICLQYVCCNINLEISKSIWLITSQLWTSLTLFFQPRYLNKELQHLEQALQANGYSVGEVRRIKEFLARAASCTFELQNAVPMPEMCIRDRVDTVQTHKKPRARTMDQWQDRWTSDTKGSWTARLIKQLTEWADRKHGEINYFITQLLTGHGLFPAYLL